MQEASIIGTTSVGGTRRSGGAGPGEGEKVVDDFFDALQTSQPAIQHPLRCFVRGLPLREGECECDDIQRTQDVVRDATRERVQLARAFFDELGIASNDPDGERRRDDGKQEAR